MTIKVKNILLLFNVQYSLVGVVHCCLFEWFEHVRLHLDWHLIETGDAWTPDIWTVRLPGHIAENTTLLLWLHDLWLLWHEFIQPKPHISTIVTVQCQKKLMKLWTLLTTEQTVFHYNLPLTKQQLQNFLLQFNPSTAAGLKNLFDKCLYIYSGLKLAPDWGYSVLNYTEFSMSICINFIFCLKRTLSSFE